MKTRIIKVTVRMPILIELTVEYDAADISQGEIVDVRTVRFYDFSPSDVKKHMTRYDHAEMVRLLGCEEL